MKPTLSITTKLYQGQVLIPQLQKSLELLTATSQELRGILEQELASNPVLEESEPLANEPEDLGDPPKDVLTDPNTDTTGSDLFERILSRGADPKALQERHQLLLDNLTYEDSINESLLAQARQANSVQYALLEFIIGNLDEHGYLTVSLDGEDFQSALEIVQSFDPPGIAARNLQECLLLQLQRKPSVNNLAVIIVRDYFQLLVKRQFKNLEQILRQDISPALAEIRGLRPYPISDTPAAAEITPEIAVDVEGNVTLASENIPMLKISSLNARLLADPTTPKETLEYLCEKIRSGKFILRSLVERSKTIERVAKEIFSRQKKFLQYGPGNLAPMTMLEIAAAVGLHETTISRTVNSKFVSTPHGIFELKYFFTTGVASGDTLTSNHNVKLLIGAIINKEIKPLSDEEIVEQLEKKNIHIARRTVAKYRQELKILPSHLRHK